LAACIVDREEQIRFQLGAREEHRERRTRPALGERVADQVLDQTFRIRRIPQQYQAHMAFLRGCFESAGPISAVVSLDVGVNRGFQRALEAGEVVCECASQRPPRHTLFIVAHGERFAGFTRRAPLRIERIDQLRILLNVTLYECVECARDVRHI